MFMFYPMANSIWIPQLPTTLLGQNRANGPECVFHALMGKR